jgi:hypothetical protein
MSRSLSTTTSAAKQAQKLLRPLRGELLRLLRDLVRTNTVAMPPEGNETPAQLILRDFLRRNSLPSPAAPWRKRTATTREGRISPCAFRAQVVARVFC